MGVSLIIKVHSYIIYRLSVYNSAKIMEGLHPAEIYEELITVRLVGMMLTIAIKRSLRPSVSKCCSAMVGTGTLKLVRYCALNHDEIYYHYHL